jgi:hypothetical protein
MVLPDTWIGGVQRELYTETVKDATGWWLAVNYWGSDGSSGGGILGWFPTSDWAGLTMATNATEFHVGGEIYDPTNTWVIPMGSGANPTAGYGQAGYHHDYEAGCPSPGCPQNWEAPTTGRPGEYDFSNTTPKPTGWGPNYFYFGNAPRVFWGTNYGYGWSPIGDWASGSYKGECGIWQSGSKGQPMTGVSEYPSGSHQAHGLRCGITSFSTTGSSCVARTGYLGTSGDWDPGYDKLDCQSNEYVSGVAQSTSGTVNKVLCCPGVTRTSCTTETFYAGNSIDYSSPDWDAGYNKGQCPSGYDVRGISKVHYSSDGVVGAPHRILCCF